MYPTGELATLAARKAIVQARIAQRRYQCLEAASALAHPVGLIDRGVETWRQIAPLVTLAGLPLALLALRRRARRSGKGTLSSLVAMLPVIMRGVRIAMQLRARRSARPSEATTPSAR